VESGCQAIENFRRVIELVVYLKRLRVVGKPRRIFDVVNVMPESLQSDDIMNVLPDHAGNRHRPHEAHHDDALAFQNILTTTAGFPATIVFVAIDFVTTAPLSKVKSPMVQRPSSPIANEQPA